MGITHKSSVKMFALWKYLKVWSTVTKKVITCLINLDEENFQK